MDKIIIRRAEAGDAAALAEIYRYYVEKTAITFEYTPPTAKEFAGRMAHTMARYPYLAAERDGEVLGYAYAEVFKDRAAYDWAVETTVYLRPDAKGQGAGRALYEALEDALGRMGILNLYACIASTDTEDEYLTNASVRFHERMGFSLCGKFSRCGCKFGRWYDMVWMEKMIGEHRDDQPAPVTFPELEC